jgi:hypothetical protein
VTPEHLEEVLTQQGDDPRALFLLAWQPGVDWAWDGNRHTNNLTRASRMGYGPAQAELSILWFGDVEPAAEVFSLAESAAAQGERLGLFQLGRCLEKGIGCAVDKVRAFALLKEAAELDCPRAQHRYGKAAFGKYDWQRYKWWGLASEKHFEAEQYYTAVANLLPAFEHGLGRILCTVAPVIRRHLDIANSTLFGRAIDSDPLEKWMRMIRRYDTVLGRAKRAIDCWSMAARRCRVAKDIRVMIAKMVWEQAWQWGEESKQENAAESGEKRARVSDGVDPE